MANASKSQGRLIVAGGINMDIALEPVGMPQVGEYTYVNAMKFIPGGNGLNVAVSAARLGARVQSVGFVGDDGIGRDLVSFLKSEGVDVNNIRTIKNIHSGVVVYMLINKEERHLVYPGSNMQASIKELPDFEIAASDIIISQMTIQQEVIRSVFAKAKRAGARTILNLFPNYDVSKEILKLCDYIILNEVELAYRTGDKDYAMAQHKDLYMDQKMIMDKVKKIRTHDGQTIIVTLADRGVIGITGDKVTEVKGIKVPFKDGTGAGDCFLGAFATGLSEGKDFKSSLQLANCAAAISVQIIGTTTSYPKRDAVNLLLQKQK